MTFSPPPITIKTAATIIIACLLVLFATSLLNHGRYQTMGNSMMGGEYAQRDMMPYEDESAYNGMGISKTVPMGVPMMAGDGAVGIDAVSDMARVSSIAPSPIPSPATPPNAESKMIRTAHLDILVADTDTAAEGVRAVSDRYQGERGNENFSQYTQDLKRGTLTIWVPSEHFDAAVRDIKNLALRVNTEVINAQDVSAQFVDLTARLKNLHAAEVQYQELLTRSGSIEDILKVTHQLAQTRQEIEQLQGQLDQLSGQVALSAITVNITPEVEVASPGQVVNEWRPGTVAKTAYRDLQHQLMQVGNGLIRFLIVGLPLLVVMGLQIAVLVAIIWVVYRLGRRIYYRMHTPPQHAHE